MGTAGMQLQSLEENTTSLPGKYTLENFSR